jgi:hypothetical protein
MTWGAVAGGVAGAVLPGLLGGGRSGGGGGASQAYYTPSGLSAADTGWQSMFGQQQDIAKQTTAATDPMYQQSLQQQQGINYQPYVQAGQQAGQMYGGLAGTAGQQMGMYGQGAQQAQQAAQGVYQTAFDPQQALYGRTQQQLQDQVRASQGARGLGVSGVGAGLENQAMSNFNIDWQNAQLGRQAQGIGAMGQANQLMGADLAAQLGAGQQQAGYTMQAGQVPIQAQQWAAQQPADAAARYQQQMLGSQQMYGNVASQAIPYMNYGQGAQQSNYQNAAAQNQAGASLGAQIGTGLWNQYGGQVKDWMSNAFGGGQQQNQQLQGWQQAASDTAGLEQAWANYTP